MLFDSLDRLSMRVTCEDILHTLKKWEFFGHTHPDTLPEGGSTPTLAINQLKRLSSYRGETGLFILKSFQRHHPSQFSILSFAHSTKL